jgi:hypothetical protein
METILAGIRNLLQGLGGGIGGGKKRGRGKTFGAPNGFDAFGQPIRPRQGRATAKATKPC